MIEYRCAWGEECVYFLDSSGHIQRIPARWTDAVGEDPFVVAAAGRSPLKVQDLLRLADLIERLDIGQKV